MVFEKLSQLIAEHFSIDVEDITMDTNFMEDLNADSIDLRELMMAAEETFGMDEVEESAMSGLKTVGDVVMQSEAIVIGHDEKLSAQPEVKKILSRLRGVLVARDYVLIEYNVPRNMLEACCQITPGIESPTISPLSNPDWVAVKAMIKSGKVNVIMDELQEKGAKGIFVTALNSCRI